MTPPLPPLAQLHRAEAETAEAICAAAHAIDTQAGALLPAALAELSAACDRARQRVQEAREEAKRMVAGLLTAFDAFTAETLEALEHNAARAAEGPSPAPAPAPASAPEGPVSPAAPKAPARKRKGAVSGAGVSGVAPALADLPPEAPPEAGAAAPTRNGRKPARAKAGAKPPRALAARGRVVAPDRPGG
jgi:hypothetical protein